MLQDYKMLPLMVGSLPHTDPVKACELVKKTFKDIPVWPQLPNRGPHEGMIAQVVRELPGITLTEDNKYVMDIESADMAEFEAFVTRAMTDDYSLSGFNEDEASGFFQFLKSDWSGAKMIKGQICGPITLALSIFDKNGKSVIYDDTVADLLVKHIKLKAMWMENEMKKISPNTVICFDEPSLSAYGSAFFSFDPNRMTAMLQEVISGCTGKTAVHSCGETFWPIVTNAGVDIINLDAFDYGQRLVLYADDLNDFMMKGGSIAYGVIPTDASNLHSRTIPQLKVFMISLFDNMLRHGIDKEHLYSNSLITPACGLAGLSEADAELALSLTVQLSDSLQDLPV